MNASHFVVFLVGLSLGSILSFAFFALVSINRGERDEPEIHPDTARLDGLIANKMIVSRADPHWAVTEFGLVGVDQWTLNTDLRPAIDRAIDKAKARKDKTMMEAANG